MDEDALIRRLREDAGLPPAAPADEWEALQGRLELAAPAVRPVRVLMAWAGASLVLVGAALLLCLPLHRYSDQGSVAPRAEDSALVLEQLMAKEYRQTRPQVEDPGAQLLALMDGV